MENETVIDNLQEGSAAGTTDTAASDTAPAQTENTPVAKPAVDEQSAANAAQDNQAAQTHFEYPKMDSPGAQAIVDVFKEKNIDPAVMEGLFAKAAQSGNLDDIDKGRLTELVGHGAAAMIMMAAAKVADDNAREVAAAKQEAFTAFGGEANWNRFLDWAHNKSSADQDFFNKLAVYRSMIDAGGEQRRLAIAALKEAYMNDPAVTVKPNLMRGDSVGGGIGNPIKSRVDYVKELSKAMKSEDFNTAVADVQARWRAAHPEYADPNYDVRRNYM